MATSDTRSRGRRFNLPTQQRRLRHLRSIAARNISVRTRPEDADDDISNLDAFLTLHTDPHSEAFFTSEKIKGSLNPTWRSFNLQHSGEPSLDTATSDVVVRVWRGKDVKYRLILEWHINMTGLVYIGDKVQQDGVSYRTNTLIFGMFEGYYSQPSPQTPGSSSLGSVGTPGSETEAGHLGQHLGHTVETAAVRDSYGVNSLSRIQTVLRAITQTQASVKKVRCRIEEKLSQSQALAEKKQDAEMLQLRVSQLRVEFRWRTSQLQTEKETHETTQANIHHRDVVLKTKYETLARDKERLHDKKRAYFDVREDLIKTGAQLVMRRKQLISELSLIYPVLELDVGDYTICGVKLPNSEDFAGQDVIMVAVALGYTTHLVQMINSSLDVPLRYPMEHRGSRSRITDHIHDKLTEKDRDFPLYGKGKEKFQFNYGVYLLNKNIAQLRYYCGLGTTDLRVTLPNLKSLLELRLGVKFDAATNPLAVTPSQHVPLPPNLGGPQKLTSNFNSRLAPRPELLLTDSKTPSRSESEDSKFEQMIQETKQCLTENHKSGALSALSSPTDTSEMSASPNSGSATSSREQTPSEKTPLVRTPSEKTPSEQTTLEQTPVIPAPSEADDLFMATPDSFFEIAVKPGNCIEHMDLVKNEDESTKAENTDAEEQLELGQDALTGTEFEHNGGLHAPNAAPYLDSSPGSEDLKCDVTNDGSQCGLVRNKHLERPLTDGDADSDVSSTEENINASYGSKFKVWPRDHCASHSHPNSDSEQQFSAGEDDMNNLVVNRVMGTPHVSEKDSSDNASGDIVSSHSYPELDYPTVSTFKTRAMSSVQPAKQKPASIRPGNDACFTRTVSPRHGHEITALTHAHYEDDICQRTDALTTNFSSFKVKFPGGHAVKSGPRGVLDDALPSGGESDH